MVSLLLVVDQRECYGVYIFVVDVEIWFWFSGLPQSQ